MLRDTDLKQFVFRPLGLLGSDDVQSILTAIKQGGSRMANRTQVKPELAMLKKQKNPVEGLVDGEKVILNKVNRVEGSFSASFFSDHTGEFLDGCLRSFPKARIQFYLKCMHVPKGHEFQLLLALEQNTCWIGYGESPKFSEVLERRVERLVFYIDHWRFPLMARMENDRYIIEHTQHGKVQYGSVRSQDKAPEWFLCTLPETSSGKIMAKAREMLNDPAIRSKSGGWFLTLTPIESSSISLDAFNTIAFPGKQIAIDYTWHLNRYENFKMMAEMAQRANNDAGQVLLEFDFGARKKCLLAAVCSKKGRYKLLFSFDKPEHAPELAKLLKIKLLPEE